MFDPLSFAAVALLWFAGGASGDASVWSPAVAVGGCVGVGVVSFVLGRVRRLRGRFNAMGPVALLGVFVVAVVEFGWPSWVVGVLPEWLWGVHEAAMLLPLAVGLALMEGSRAGGLGVGRALRYGFERFRQRSALVLLVFAVISGWSRAVDALVWRRLGGGEAAEAWAAAGHALGAIGVIALMPIALSALWRTRGVPAGELRDRLLAVCQDSGVRVLMVRLWRPPAMVINAAMVGVLPATRAILLSEDLVRNLAPAEVEAVMAHEAGHARLWHLLWLVTVTAGWFGAGWAFVSAGFTVLGIDGELAGWLAMGVGGLIGIDAFGRASRVFEREADAFSARVMAGRLGGDAAGASAMASALSRVAWLAGVSTGRFGFRHGSIDARIEALREIALAGSAGGIGRAGVSVRAWGAGSLVVALLGVMLL